MLVPKNFMFDQSHGQFSLTKNIYIESENYSGNKDDIPNFPYTNYLGGHALVVVGWGIEKDVFIPSSKITMNIPYFIVRNSWGKNWGLSIPTYEGTNVGGYFKIAMYQPATGNSPVINPNTAIERVSPLQGGVLVFEPDQILKYNNPNSLTCLDPSFDLYNSKQVLKASDVSFHLSGKDVHYLKMFHLLGNDDYLKMFLIILIITAFIYYINKKF